MKFSFSSDELNALRKAAREPGIKVIMLDEILKERKEQKDFIENLKCGAYNGNLIAERENLFPKETCCYTDSNGIVFRKSREYGRNLKEWNTFEALRRFSMKV